MPKTSEKPQPDGQGKRNKNRRNGQIKVVCNWQHTEEVSLAFKHLMALLLRDREKERDDEYTESQHPIQG